jgi:hypothetical protein
MLNTNKISFETLRKFENSLIIGAVISYKESARFGRGDDMIGTSIRIRRNIQTSVTENDMSWSGANTAITETSVSLVIDRTLTTKLSFSDADLKLKIEKFSDRVLKRAMATMAAKYDSAICKSISNATVGTNGFGGSDQQGNAAGNVGTPNFAGYVVGMYGVALTPAAILKAKSVLFDQSCPLDGELYGVLSSGANAELNAAQATLFNPLTEINKSYKAGYIKEYADIKFAQSQSLSTHTNGAQPTLVASGAGELNPAVSGAAWAETTSITVTATTQAIKAGDVYEVTGVKLVNIYTKEVTDHNYQFTVLADYASGATSILVGPAPIISGDYQNVSATLAGKTITLTGSTTGALSVNLTGTESLIFHKDAIEAVAVGLDVPRGKDMAFAIEDEDIEKFKMRFIRDYDTMGVGGVNGTKPGYVARLDAAYGFKTVIPQWICRVRR